LFFEIYGTCGPKDLPDESIKFFPLLLSDILTFFLLFLMLFLTTVFLEFSLCFFSPEMLDALVDVFEIRSFMSCFVKPHPDQTGFFLKFTGTFLFSYFRITP